MSEKYEVSSIASDSYQFYLDLARKTREDIEKVESRIKEKKTEIVSLKQAISEAESDLAGLEKSLTVLKQKGSDIKGVIGDLEKNKAQFQSIVAGSR